MAKPEEKEKQEQFDPEKCLEFLKRKDVDAGFVLLALREAVVYLLENEVKKNKAAEAWFNSDAEAMKEMAEEQEEKGEEQANG